MAPSDLEAAVRDDDLIDFSSYVIINNLSDEDFLLSDSGISGRYGVWPEGMPLNTIDAHQAEQIQLKDPDSEFIVEGRSDKGCADKSQSTAAQKAG